MSKFHPDPNAGNRAAVLRLASNGRKVLSARCAALDSNGKRCSARQHLKLIKYHGDGEIYDFQGPEPTWVLVHLCPSHRKED